jgi:N-acetyl-anhydromuramyl-L-alanine amidase AmpD
VPERPEYNTKGIGICLIGNFETAKPTGAQVNSLSKLTEFLRRKYGIPLTNILAHGDVKNTACPGRYFNFPMFIDTLRKRGLKSNPA